jgi:dTDP-4-dehydrorhamnose reductase
MNVHERTLITGGGGQLASDLEALLGERGLVRARSHAELDITDDAAVAEEIARVAPTVVYNCAAYHNVDACEGVEARAFEVNARAVKRLAQLSAEHGARLVHVSTNYVFDGTGDTPWTEEDLPRPRSIYGLSKLAGEHAALAYAPDALVVRTGGLYGEHGSASKGGNFVVRMIARARDSSPPTPLRMVADQRLTPTATSDLAAALVEASERGVGGLLHLTNAGACSWYEFTAAIMEEAAIDVPIEPVTTSRGGADRPLNGVLSCARAEAAGLAPLPHWRDALRRYLARTGLVAAAA